MKNDEIIDNIKWFINISSEANINFAQEQIEKIIFCYKEPEYQELKIKHNTSGLKEFEKYSVASWQITKSDELEKKFFDNLKYEIKDEKLFINIQFDINFTEEFNKGDVISWVEGFNRFNKIFPMIGLSLLKKDVILYEQYEKLYIKAMGLLEELTKNENIIAYKEGEEPKENKSEHLKLEKMKYFKGNQTYKLEQCEYIKLRLVDNEDFAETPWAKKFGEEKESVLQNHALAFTPFHSWGVVLPTIGGSFNFIETLEKGELVLHPEAWDSYIEHKIIDETGNYIYVHTHTQESSEKEVN